MLDIWQQRSPSIILEAFSSRKQSHLFASWCRCFWVARMHNVIKNVKCCPFTNLWLSSYNITRKRTHGSDAHGYNYFGLRKVILEKTLTSLFCLYKPPKVSHKHLQWAHWIISCALVSNKGQWILCESDHLPMRIRRARKDVTIRAGAK